ncbi:replication initiation protein RepC [Varunaivibrio sulfuroxidans]|uniref:replication initiation protein RepC n=1 Tax=Varunaivibrio sulfuroxidans TaxID=1773489 RepID=UPI00104D5F5D|nr:replication initiation protein RepC [Varunaivibrio sulfuroxidans]
MDVADLVDAAGRLCPHLEISRSAWVAACAVMGRAAAAVAVIVIDRNMEHPETPIRSPGGVLRAMTARAKVGELHLEKSIFGILERDHCIINEQTLCFT